MKRLLAIIQHRAQILRRPVIEWILRAKILFHDGLDVSQDGRKPADLRVQSPDALRRVLDVGRDSVNLFGNVDGQRDQACDGGENAKRLRHAGGSSGERNDRAIEVFLDGDMRKNW